MVRISKKHFFKEEVKKAWIPLMLHCQDPCSDAAEVRHALLSVSRGVGTAGPKRRMCEGVPPPPLLVPHARLGRGLFRGPTDRLMEASPLFGGTQRSFLLRLLPAGLLCPVSLLFQWILQLAITLGCDDSVTLKTHLKSLLSGSPWGRPGLGLRCSEGGVPSLALHTAVLLPTEAQLLCCFELLPQLPLL